MARGEWTTAGTGNYSSSTGTAVSSNNIWIRWNTTSSGTATISNSSHNPNYAWDSWQGTGTIANSISSDTSNCSDPIYGNWIVEEEQRPRPHINHPAIGEIRRQEQAREDRQRNIDQARLREQEARIRKLKDAKDKAEEKAKLLLLDLIGEAQLVVYEKTGRLFVKGRKYDYIVQKEGFIKQLTKDKVLDICVHLAEKDRMPDTDNVVGLKLMLENEEDKMLNMANIHNRTDRENFALPEAACANWN